MTKKSKRPVKVKGVPNATEIWYAKNVLEPLKKKKKIKSYKYEAKKFVLGKKESRCTYTPDYEVVLPSGSIEYHEVKGSWSMRGANVTRIKIKWAAYQYPQFKWIGLVISGQKIKKTEEF